MLVFVRHLNPSQSLRQKVLKKVCQCVFVYVWSVIKIYSHPTTPKWGRTKTIHHLVDLLWCHNVISLLHTAPWVLFYCFVFKPKSSVPSWSTLYLFYRSEGDFFFNPYIQLWNHPKLFLIHPLNMLFQKKTVWKKYMGLTNVLFLLTDLTLN